MNLNHKELRLIRGYVFRQLILISEALLMMHGRITMPRISRWTRHGSSPAKRELKDKTETSYFISSLDENDPVRLEKAVRAHWAIESNFHWVLEVAFDKDRNRTRNGGSAANLGITRHTTLNLIKNERSSRVGVKTKRTKAGWDQWYLAVTNGRS